MDATRHGRDWRGETGTEPEPARTRSRAEGRGTCVTTDGVCGGRRWAAVAAGTYVRSGRRQPPAGGRGAVRAAVGGSGGAAPSAPSHRANVAEPMAPGRKRQAGDPGVVLAATDLHTQGVEDSKRDFQYALSQNAEVVRICWKLVTSHRHRRQRAVPRAVWPEVPRARRPSGDRPVAHGDRHAGRGPARARAPHWGAAPRFGGPLLTSDSPVQQQASRRPRANCSPGSGRCNPAFDVKNHPMTDHRGDSNLDVGCLELHAWTRRPTIETRLVLEATRRHSATALPPACPSNTVIHSSSLCAPAP